MTDHSFFRTLYPACCIRVRVRASEDTRKARGWVFQENVDDAESECGLDWAEADHELCNDGDKDAEAILTELVQKVVCMAKS